MTYVQAAELIRLLQNLNEMIGWGLIVIIGMLFITFVFKD